MSETINPYDRIADWIESLYIPASSIGDNKHIAAQIRGMKPSDPNYNDASVQLVIDKLHELYKQGKGFTGIAVRVSTYCHRNGIKTVAELRAALPIMRRQPNIGPKTARLTTDIMQEFFP